MKHLTAANRWNADLIDHQYEVWLRAPESLDSDWRAFFEGYTLAQPVSGAAGKSSSEDVVKQAKILALITAYRTLGHFEADCNPLEVNPQKNAGLQLENLGLTESDLDGMYYTGDFLGGQMMTGKAIVSKLREIYCGRVGIEVMHIQNPAKRKWMLDRVERGEHVPKFSRQQKIRMLHKINEGELFEHFLHTRFVGQKRFSLEGGESLMSGLDCLVEACPQNGVESIVFGMAHRGRLGVLTNFMNKPYYELFKEFTEGYIPAVRYGDGDVKYHLGYDKAHETTSGKIVDLTLAPNPSHLEFVNSVVEGMARARQIKKGDDKRNRVLPLLIHGDAAMIGQGIVAEIVNMARLKGYSCGGTLHVAINNQVGFTTNPEDGRSSPYCTDVGKIIEVPAFHVNGDDPMAFARIMELALEYRQAFSDDVFIDLICYRKYGHNETDEPLFTQPTLYRKIAEHPLVSRVYSKELIASGDLTEEQYQTHRKTFEQVLDAEFELSRMPSKAKKDPQPPQPAFNFDPAKTAVDEEKLQAIGKVLTTIPEGFKINPKIDRQIQAKRDALSSRKGIDWALAEALAFGSIVQDGHPLRLSGEDCERGTFSHRHAVCYDHDSRQRWCALENVDPNQGLFTVHNSPLSEEAVMGFDYGYSVEYPEGLTLWEAQFGDFANGAQVIIDKYIANAESKWGCLSSLTLLLPHGMEGQGPEHSSAYLERYLQMCAESNIQVAYPTTPAQFFHLLRRQLNRKFLKPLVVMSPKSLFRNKECISRMEELTSGTFQEILSDLHAPKKASRVIVCSGKIYYELAAYRAQNKIEDVAIVRIEQLYPLNTEQLKEVMKPFEGYQTLVWCQEEPQNMGAYHHLVLELEAILGKRPVYAGRKAAASQAVGWNALYKVEQAALIESAFKNA
jgi:2-oxoglutarate dehydrogenase E1 component